MRQLRSVLPPLNFITIHYGYFIFVTLAASLVFWGSSDPQLSISYVDSLFLVISAMTEAGLNTVNLSQMTTWQQILLWLLIIVGSSVWVSIWTVLVRKRAFERRFEEIVKKERQRSLARRNTSISLLPIAQRFRSFSRSGRNASQLPTSAQPLPPIALATRGPEVSALPISGPIDRRPISTVVPTTAPPAQDATAAQSAPDSPAKESSTPRGPGPLADEPPVPPEVEAPPFGRPTTGEHIAFSDDIFGPRATSSSLSLGPGVVRRQPAPGGTTGNPLPSSAEQPHPQPQPRLGAYKVGRNAQFHGLTSDEREHLGGTEYRALKLLSVVVPIYFVSWQFLGCIALGAWIANNQPQPAEANSISPWWNGIFNGVSAFNNSGMSVLDLNMIPYGSSYFVLIVMGAMILAGNTAYPIFLRLWLWSCLKLLNFATYPQDFADWKATLEYILRYPRRVYTNLFPARQSWWLLFMLFVLNGTDWVAFEILNIGNPNLGQTPVGSRIIDGLFQALAVRSGGFYVVSIPSLYIGLQVLYVIMYVFPTLMYISVYPVVITMRHSNVYEERSLGIYDEGDEDDHSSVTSIDRRMTRSSTTGTRSRSVGRAIRHFFAEWHGVGAAPAHVRPGGAGGYQESRVSFISHQVRGQLSHDLWWLVLAVWLIVIIETRHFMDDPVTYSVFNVVFEVVSAYGCVGISVGLPNQAYSFSGGWYTGSKLVLCAVMLRGRHRGLPVALDRAIKLPDDDMHRVEEEDHQIRRSMSARRPSIDDRAFA
ncbi:TrkH-domain-containing protein [Xylariomycetidae sp. FL0641]|nr:TrkH-domain-containing protein [Xylariomycetidae sp. FL0641]